MAAEHKKIRARALHLCDTRRIERRSGLE
jgi:hypothetical protein